jgi:protein Mpv17
MFLANADQAVFGPVATLWFRFLQRNIVLKNQKTTIIARVAADQCLFAPAHLTFFLSSMAIMEGTDPVAKWKQSFLPGYKANLAVWPLVQGINFAFVPLELRVLVVNVISLGTCGSPPSSRTLLTCLLGWNCVLSVINSGGK